MRCQTYQSRSRFHFILSNGSIGLIGIGVLWESLAGPSGLGWGAIILGFLIKFLTESLKIQQPPFVWPVAIILMMSIVSLAITADRGATLVQLSRLGAGFAICYGIVNWTHNRYRLIIVTLVLVGAGVLLALSAPVTVDWEIGKGGIIPDAVYQYFPLLLSDAIHPNTMATMLILVMPLPLAFVSIHGLGLKRPFKYIRATAVLTYILLAIVLLMTKSRAGYLAAGMAALLTLWWGGRRKIAFVCAILMAGVITWFFVLARSQMTNFATGVDDPGSFLFRLEIWPIAIQMIRDFPFTGVGMGTFNEVALRLYPIPIGAIDNPGAHNLWLQVGADLGVIGLIAFLSILFLTGFMGWRTMQAAMAGDDRLLQSMSIGALAGFIGYNIHGVIDIVVWGTRGAFMPWLLIGLITALYLQTLAKA